MSTFSINALFLELLGTVFFVHATLSSTGALMWASFGVLIGYGSLAFCRLRMYGELK